MCLNDLSSDSALPVTCRQALSRSASLELVGIFTFSTDVNGKRGLIRLKYAKAGNSCEMTSKSITDR